MPNSTQRVDFEGSQGAKLSARLDLPGGAISAYAIFAHCFTCSKDLNATRLIAQELANQGIAVLRFDFTGLGSSEGEFASTNFSTNIEDLEIAANYLRVHFEAPQLLIGHSLGGAAVLSVAGNIPEVRAVATLGAPADAGHVVHNFGPDLEKIKAQGEAEVVLGGRTFTIRKQFLDDLQGNTVLDRVSVLKKPLLVLHSPTDQTVGVENAQQIFQAAKHPKSFVSLDQADHLLNDKADAAFAASVIAAWSVRYIAKNPSAGEETGSNLVSVSETGNGKFQNNVRSGNHTLLADEPTSVGGLDSGPSPYDLVAMGLGACTSMTLRMYAEFKKLDVGKISVDVDHTKVHADDCMDCMEEQVAKGGKIDRFERTIKVAGLEDEAIKEKLLKIADRCPVHKTLEHGASIVTKIA